MMSYDSAEYEIDRVALVSLHGIDCLLKYPAITSSLFAAATNFVIMSRQSLCLGQDPPFPRSPR